MSLVCTKCGSVIRSALPAGQCPRCLLGLGRAAPVGESVTGMSANPGSEELLTRLQVRRFGDYELNLEIARGGMGIVYQAQQISLNRPVALKMMLAGQLATPEAVARFQFEAQAAASLAHPNIVPIYEVGEQDGCSFFSMRLVNGQTLGKVLSGRPLAFERAARLLAAVARAIQHAHERGVLHRDLKPGNILIDTAGEPHVTDFGLAKLMESDLELTRSHMTVGTPAYMSPEQAAGRVKQITTAADIYGLGAVLFEMLTGKPPFSGETPIAIVRKVLDEDPPLASRLNPAVPPELATIAMKCLEKEPHRRYGSAAALAADLERWLRHEPIEAHSASTWERTRKWVRRKPVDAAFAGTLVLAVVVLLVGLLWHSHQIQVAQKATQALNRDLAKHLRTIEWQQVENGLHAGRTTEALATFARFLRETPNDNAVARRLISMLEMRAFPLPALAPLEHGVPVNKARMDSTGQGLLTVADDGILRTWDLKTATLAHQASLDLGGANFEWFPDRKRVALATKRGQVLVWNSESKTVERELGVVADDRRKLQLSEDGAFMAIVNPKTEIQLWSTETGKLLGALSPPVNETIYLGGVSTNREVVFHGQHHGAWLWRVAQNELKVLLETRESPVVIACDWKRRRAYVAFEHLRGPMQGIGSLDLDSGQVLAHNAHTPPWHIIIPVPNQPRLVVASWGPGVCVINADTLQQEMPQFASSPIHANVSTDRDFQLAYNAAHDGTGRLYSLGNGQPLLEPVQHDGAITSHELSPDGSLLVTASQDGTARLWDLRMRVTDSVHIRNDQWIFGFDLSPDGQRLVIASDRQARVHDAETGMPLTPPVTARDYIFKAKFSPNGRLIATASFDYSALVWDAQTGEPVGSGTRHSGRVWLTMFSHDNLLVASASEDGTSRVFEAATGRLLYPPLKHANEVIDVSFSPDDSLVATASVDATARLWNAKTGVPVGPALRHQGTVWTASFSDDGRHLLTASNDRTAQIWDVRTGQPAAPPIRSDQSLMSAVFSANGEQVLITTLENARIFDARTSQPLTIPMYHGSRVWFGRFSPNGRSVATISEDGLARVWDATTGFPITEPLRHSRMGTSLAWLPDSQRLLSGSQDGTVRLWKVPQLDAIPPWLPELAEALAGRMDDGRGGRVSVGTDRLDRLRELAGSPEGTSPGNRWLRWFLVDRLQTQKPQ